MSSKRSKTKSIIPVYINGLNTNYVHNIRLDESGASVHYYDSADKKIKLFTVSKDDPSYSSYETYVFRYNSAFHMSKL